MDIYDQGMSAFALKRHSAHIVQNMHHLGDQWNGEDLSIFSLDDRPLPLSPIPPTPTNGSTVTLDKAGPSTRSETPDKSKVKPENLKASLKTPSISSRLVDSPPELTNSPGYRAAEAYVRPSPVAAVGHIINYGFDLRNCVFKLRLLATHLESEDTPTEIFLPEFHFPRDKCDVEVSSGKWTISTDDMNSGTIQILRWWHTDGENTLKVTGVQRRQNTASGEEGEEGYIDQCQQSKCSVM